MSKGFVHILFTIFPKTSIIVCSFSNFSQTLPNEMQLVQNVQKAPLQNIIFVQFQQTSFFFQKRGLQMRKTVVQLIRRKIRASKN